MKAKKVTAFIGTQRKDGLVSSICRKVLEGAQSGGAAVEMVNLYDYKLEHCTGCWTCFRQGRCVHSDDFEMLFAKWRESRVVVLGSPVYWGNVSGIMKDFFDRFIAYAIASPDDASNLKHLPRFRKYKTMIREVARFGPEDQGLRKKPFVLIMAATLPFPFAIVCGQTRQALGAMRNYVRRVKGKVVARIVYTDSLLRIRQSKEQRVLRRAYRLGQKIAQQSWALPTTP